MNINNNNLSNVKIENNEITIEINEGRAQLNKYWIARIEKNGSNYSIEEFVNGKCFDKTKIFTLQENVDYVVSFGASTKNDKSRRNFAKVVNGVVELY